MSTVNESAAVTILRVTNKARRCSYG